MFQTASDEIGDNSLESVEDVARQVDVLPRTLPFAGHVGSRIPLLRESDNTSPETEAAQRLSSPARGSGRIPL